MADTLFVNATLIQSGEEISITSNVDVAVCDTLIVEVGKHLKQRYPHFQIIDCTDKLLVPGFVCSHHHYYSALSRGMLVSSGPQNDFIQVLKEWWWRLDRALDEEAIYYSSLICSLDAIKAGTTSCIDHHASPSCIPRSLTTIAEGMREVGIRGCTCYEVTDRNQGMKEVEEGIQENIDFALGIDQSDQRRLVEAMIGAHASFTVPEEALKLLKEAVDTTHRGLHIHVAEDSYDVSHSHHRYHKDIITRLDEAALLTDNTLLVHALHLNENEIRRVNQRGSFVAHNPRSNMNNQVGYMKHLAQVNNLVLGTDGCGGNMFEELKIAFFKHRDALGTLWPPDFFKALNRGNQLLQKSFGRRFGRIESGYVADLVVLDYQSPTALVPENVASHFVWGISSNAVESVMVNGKMVLNQRIFPFDEKEIYAKAAQIAKRIWKRVDHLRS